MRVQRFVAGLAIFVLAGCDNINWGGAEVAIVPPPQVNAQPATGRGVGGTEVEERLPEGPVLYYVVNAQDGPIMMPVAEISADTLLPIRARGDAQAFAQRFIASH